MLSEYNGTNINYGIYYFYASWSSKCNLHLDALKRIQIENKDLDIVKINITKYMDLKHFYNVKKIPTYIFINDGKIISRIDGFVDQFTLSRWVKKNRG